MDYKKKYLKYKSKYLKLKGGMDEKYEYDKIIEKIDIDSIQPIINEINQGLNHINAYSIADHNKEVMYRVHNDELWGDQFFRALNRYVETINESLEKLKDIIQFKPLRPEHITFIKSIYEEQDILHWSKLIAPYVLPKTLDSFYLYDRLWRSIERLLLEQEEEQYIQTLTDVPRVTDHVSNPTSFALSNTDLTGYCPVTTSTWTSTDGPFSLFPRRNPSEKPLKLYILNYHSDGGVDAAHIPSQKFVNDTGIPIYLYWYNSHNESCKTSTDLHGIYSRHIQNYNTSQMTFNNMTEQIMNDVKDMWSGWKDGVPRYMCENIHTSYVIKPSKKPINIPYMNLYISDTYSTDQNISNPQFIYSYDLNGVASRFDIPKEDAANITLLYVLNLIRLDYLENQSEANGIIIYMHVCRGEREYNVQLVNKPDSLDNEWETGVIYETDDNVDDVDDAIKILGNTEYDALDREQQQQAEEDILEGLVDGLDMSDTQFFLNQTVNDMPRKNDPIKHKEALDKSKVQTTKLKTIHIDHEGLSSPEMRERGLELIETLKHKIDLRNKIMPELEDNSNLVEENQLSIDKLQKTIEEIEQILHNPIFDPSESIEQDILKIDVQLEEQYFEEQINNMRKKNEMLQYWEEQIKNLPSFKIGWFENELRKKLQDRFTKILSQELDQKEIIFEEVYQIVFVDYKDEEM
jgi:hypothetical protein